MVLLEGGDRLSITVELVLHRLCISATLSGMWYLAYAIQRTVEDSTYIRYMVKGIYIDVAKHYNTTPDCVERAMRFAINACWTRGGRNELDQMAGHHLVKRPTNREFIYLVALYIRRRT